MNNFYKRMFVVSLLLIIIALVGVKDAMSGEKITTGIEGTSIEEFKPLTKIDRRIKEERMRISKFSEHVRRDGDTLYLKLSSGAKVIMKNQSECDEYYTCGDSYFEEYLPDLGLYILNFQLHEGSHYLVIFRSSGKKYIMYAYPEVSPDRLRLVAASSSGEAYGESSIQLWRIEQNKLIEEFYLNPLYFNLNYFVKWQDNSTVIVKRFMRIEKIPSCTESDFVEAQFALRKKGDSWKLDKDFIEGTVICTPN